MIVEAMIRNHDLRFEPPRGAALEARNERVRLVIGIVSRRGYDEDSSLREAG